MDLYTNYDPDILWYGDARNDFVISRRLEMSFTTFFMLGKLVFGPFPPPHVELTVVGVILTVGFIMTMAMLENVRM